eukprot:comp12184_c0_seq1/m.6944 comp12184_c0_seq1/g.6944  ORF comp12184_c0_seq1/g.6944 comp12184_c0_seq1/m.6944 type:complete len:145 (-) comp12184_c0_seq1:407-841(-)
MAHILLRTDVQESAEQYATLEAERLARLQAAVYEQSEDAELAVKVDRAITSLSDDIYLLANEPSVGLYRVYEHICNSVPAFPERKAELGEVQNKIQGCIFDVDYAISTISEVTQSRRSFNSIQGLFTEAIAAKQKIDESLKAKR